MQEKPDLGREGLKGQNIPGKSSLCQYCSAGMKHLAGGLALAPVWELEIPHPHQPQPHPRAFCALISFLLSFIPSRGGKSWDHTLDLGWKGA